MTAVKGSPPTAEIERHVPMLVGKLFAEVRDAFAAEDWGGLRQSHFRLMDHVPPGGIPITDLAAAIRMTKQACGQFVTNLVGTGHLEIHSDPADRRIRLVTLTPLGRRTVKAVNRRIRRIENEWADRVGPARYATFREVLDEIVAGSGTTRGRVDA